MLAPQTQESYTDVDVRFFVGNDPPNGMYLILPALVSAEIEFISDRTSELRKYGYTGRNLKKIQMTTDTAVRVTRMVVEGKRTWPWYYS